MAEIHPLALIEDGAEIGEGTSVAAFAVVKKNAVIGKNCRIMEHAVIASGVRMGDGNTIHQHAAVGGTPQDKSFSQDRTTYLDIGDNNVFREFTSIHNGAKTERTSIGSGNYFMTCTHIGHDCSIGNDCVFSSYSALGGHVIMGSSVNCAPGVLVHQFCRIGSYTMISPGLKIRKDVLPFTLLAGEPPRHYRLNRIGLRRAGLNSQQIKTIELAYDEYRASKTLGEYSSSQDVTVIKAFIEESSQRGIYPFLSVKSPLNTKDSNIEE